ncbi:hypothetical protein QJS10_CPB13g01127 [Acorus calamus]|uniref:Uncharacterized protein n=1 Tax=Acorus calamus TaxID=4465 RepID=A0AAV9DE78_ACOCL|nr:hypothetical protein QJS10_CPB13g01127 [Acorus calamus]
MIDIPESVVMTWSKFDRFLFPSDNLDHERREDHASLKNVDDVFAAPPSPPANEPDPLAPIIFEAEQEKKIEKKSAEPITVGYDKGYHKDFRDCKDGVPEPGPERVIQVLRPPLLESDADHDKEDLPNPTSPSQQKEMPGQPKVANVAGVKNEPVEIPVEAEACPPTADATETVVHMNEDLVTLASGVNDQDDIEDDSIVLIHRASLTWGGENCRGRRRGRIEGDGKIGDSGM